MKHVNVLIPDELHDFLHRCKREWGLKTLDETLARILEEYMKGGEKGAHN